MIQDRALAFQIEIGMISKIYDRVLVSRRAILDFQLIRIKQTVSDLRSDIAGVSLFAVSAQIRKMQNGSVSFARGPNAFVESIKPAVQMIEAVICFELIIASVQRKSTHADAVRMTSVQTSKIKRIPDVLIERLKPEDDIAQRTIAIGNLERSNRAAVIDDSDFNARAIRECVEINFGAFRLAKVCFCYAHSLLKTRFASSNVSADPTSYH